MSKVPGPLEGKIVLLSYIECDNEAENTVCLVYKVTAGKLRPLLGVLDLPSEISAWEYPYYKNEDIVLKILASEKVSEVFTPLWCKKFLGMDLGYFDISEGVNAKNEVECWGEFQGITYGVFHDWLDKVGIAVRFVDAKTMEIHVE